MNINTFTQTNMDGWGDVPHESDTWDDYYECEPVIDEEDPQVQEDRAALETELADAIRRGDDDAIDQAAEQLAQVNADASPLTTTKPKRKSTWKPPPQCGLIDKSGDSEWKPKSEMWQKPTPLKSGRSMRKRFPTLREAQSDDSHDDIMLLASIRKGAPVPRTVSSKPKLARGRKIELFKVGAMGHKEQKHREYVERRKSGVETTREKQGRERNEQRSAMFTKVAEAHDKPASERAKDLGWVRTSPCRSVGTGKPCPHGSRCRFAHTPEELGVKRCHFGDRCRKKGTCRFPHSDEEVAAALAKARAHMTELMCKAC